MTKNGVTTTYTYDANNRLLTESKAGDVILYQYDANGNTLRAVRGGDGIGAYTYNLFGNQVSYTPTGVVFTSYTYRPDGLRHSIGNTVHLWDGENIVADIVGNSITAYIRGLTLLYANDGNEIYYHFNAHGDVVVLTDEDGTKEKSYSYNAFGVEEDPSALDDNPFRYCGEYFDKVNEKIYLRARYYDAGQGRFTQEDPISDGYNWYSYCYQNPIMFIDPNGTDAYYVLLYAEDDGLPIVGHAALLIEDENSQWYFVEFDGTTIENARIWINSVNLETQLSSWKNEKMVYLEGNFVESLEYARKWKEQDIHYGGYKFFTHNCLHFAKNSLSRGDFKCSDVEKFVKESDQIVPVLFYSTLNKKVAINHYIDKQQINMDDISEIKSVASIKETKTGSNTNKQHHMIKNRNITEVTCI